MLKRLLFILLFIWSGFIVKAQGSCNAFFIFNIQNGNTVQFFNSSTVGLPITWNFGDGHLDTNYSPAPHWYQSTGTYIVCVTVGDSSCSASFCDTIQILHTPCTANYIFYPNGNVAHVENLSTPLYPAYGSIWNYGDGTTDTSTFPAAHLYNHPGTYIVCLTIHDSACISTQCDTITVNTDSCQAQFNYTQTDNHLLFLNSSLKPADAFCYWEFGDGHTSSHCDSVTNVYVTTGTYYVCLTVYDSLCQNTYCDTITVTSVNGIRNENEDFLHIFPNPFSGVLLFNEAVNYYQLSSLSGQLLMSGDNTSSVNTEGLPKGPYIVAFQTKSKNWRHQLLIKN